MAHRGQKRCPRSLPFLLNWDGGGVFMAIFILVLKVLEVL
jgi:hypothetical protein